MKRKHPANKPITFKDRSDLLLSTEATYPDFRAKTIPYLSNIPEKAIADLMGKTKTIRYIRKEPIDSECTKPDSLVIVFSGNAKIISLYDGSCKGAMIRVEEPQSDFGNIALITEELRSVSAITLERTVFAVILKNDFMDWLMNYPDVELTLLGVVKGQLDS